MEKPSIDLLPVACLGVVFCSIMAVVSSGFVLGVLYFTGLRSRMIHAGRNIWCFYQSVVVLWLLPAGLVVSTRRSDMDGWQTPADSIYAAHLPDSQLDHKRICLNTCCLYLGQRWGISGSIWAASAFWA